MSRWSEHLLALLDERATMVETECGSIQLAREGDGSKVMPIHGSPGGFDQGLVWAKHLKDGGCELIAPSRPGHLRTPLDSGRSPALQADLFAAMLDALCIDKVTVLGISSGGPSAVHFAARHPNRTNALLLDAAVLLPIAPATNMIERALFESNTGIWLWYQMAKRWPKSTASLVVDNLSTGLDKGQKREAVDWITSNPIRLHDIVALSTSLAPRTAREHGQRNDESNEIELAPLPFAEITAPTLIAQGANDVFPLIDHATNAVDKIPGAELIIVKEGHHGLPWCPHIGAVTQRQLELSLA